jgi:hypothetical protein
MLVSGIFSEKNFETLMEEVLNFYLYIPCYDLGLDHYSLVHPFYYRYSVLRKIESPNSFEPNYCSLK